ncbi:MAG TPA: hypothetical protein VFX30_04160 [bacterium]|nr:hypothetical protein [bacterium]
MKRFALSLGLAAVLLSPAIQAAPHNDFEDVSWISGGQRHIYGTVFTQPADPGVVDVYVIGPVNADDPLDDVTLDPHYPYVHDHVTTKVPFGHRKLARFLVVDFGVNGNAGNVHTRTVVANPDFPPIEPEDGSFHVTPTREAPYEIDLGTGFVPLTSVEVVQAGITAGLLRTIEIAQDISVTGWSGGTVGDE